MTVFDAKSIAVALCGVVTGPNQVLAPGPGHLPMQGRQRSAKRRGLPALCVCLAQCCVDFQVVAYEPRVWKLDHS